MRITVVIPCAAKHVPLLDGLLRELVRQSRPPDEVVIALSGARRPLVKSARARFPVHVLADPLPQNAAYNRNRATSAVTGDVVVYQDADDLPHPQRLEIVATAFARSSVDHLMHGFYQDVGVRAGRAWRAGRYDVRSLEKQLRFPGQYTSAIGLTNGNPAVTRSMLARVRWPDERRVGEDVVFNERCYATDPRRCAILNVPLLLYRHSLSATS